VMAVKGTDAILKKLASLKKTEKIVSAVGQLVAEEVVDRTLQGKDMHDHAFAPYSPKYAGFRAEKGRQVSPVNLKSGINRGKAHGGNMLGSITSKSDGTKAIVYFNKETENAKAHGHHTGGGRNKKREFFGVSPAVTKKVMTAVKKHYRSKIDG